MSSKIKSIKAREILDSRGYPTLETMITLKDGSSGLASVPSGASQGKYEALELRDNDQSRFNGLGVLKAMENVNQKIFPLLRNLSVEKQLMIDNLMIDLDGTENKSRLGANAILSVSQALIRAAANSQKLPLYQYLKKKFGLIKTINMPKPTFNLINAGKHGDSNLEFQEFHLLPAKQKSFKKNLQVGEEIYQQLKEVLRKEKLDTDLGDEGGFSPNLLSNLEALELIKKAVKKASYRLGQNVFLGLDAAASNFFKKGKYQISDFSRSISPEQLTSFYIKLAKSYHFRYLEDPLAEESWPEWQKLTEKFSSTKVLIVGDDLLCTHPDRLKKAIEEKTCNAILIKPNQIGTISETIEVIKIAKQANIKIIVSHRSGETIDDFIADLAVGVGADLVKFGAPARGERIVKYNRLMEIENQLIA